MTVGQWQGKESMDQFPVGMRVLAVDDDPVCLKLLDTLLRHCQYHVTTTSQAVTALKMLREKDQFDLVISDVHMPDMDGFKLLELVGLEMDLPVIMLSANGETQTVMKGINHGACDYLLKPVRIEELRNIWQHVVRKRKSNPRHHSSKGNDDADHKVQPRNAEDEQGGANGNRKLSRKDQDDRDDSNEINENMNLSTLKRARMVWSVELHRKFVDVVNELGVDRAVPKKILDMMDVNHITRENVASHLQKYRLYLKRISPDRSNQANQAAAASGGRKHTCINKNELENFKHYHTYGRRRPSSAVASSRSSNLLARMNSPSALGAHGLLPRQTINLGNAQSNLDSSLKDMRTVGHGGNLLNGVPGSMQDVSKCFSSGLSVNSFANVSNAGLLRASRRFPSGSSGNSYANISNGRQLGASKSFPAGHSGNSFANMSNGRPLDASTSFPSGHPGNSYANMSNGRPLDASKSFPCGHPGNSYANMSNGRPLDMSKGFSSSQSGNSFANISNGGLLAPANRLPMQSPPELGNQPSGQMHSSSTDIFSTIVGEVPQFPDLGKCSNSWKSVVPSKSPPELGHKDGMSQGPSQMNIPKIDQFSSFAVPSGQIPMFGNELQNQMASLSCNTTQMTGFNEQMAPFNSGSNTSSMEMMNNNLAFCSASSISSPLPNLQIGNFVVPTQTLNGESADGILPVQHGTVDQQAVGEQLNDNDFFMGMSEPNNGLSADLDDIVAELLNSDFLEDGAFMDRDWELVP